MSRSSPGPPKGGHYVLWSLSFKCVLTQPIVAVIGPFSEAAERTLVLVFASPEVDQTHNQTMTTTTISERN
jgi:hypothetical protein